MLRDVLARIEERLTAVGLTATGASRKAGLSEDAIRNIRRAVARDEPQGVSTKTIDALAPVLETTPAWLIEGVGPDADPMVPVIGSVGADPEGRILFSTGDDPGYRAPIPPGGTGNAKGLFVRGHSMRGLAEDGGLIYFEDQRVPPTPDMLTYPCVVETEDGEVLVKRLLRGSGPGLYDLESLNGPLLRDKRLRWAAEITAVLPPRQTQRVVRHVSEMSL
jgi:hypothetical protein